MSNHQPEAPTVPTSRRSFLTRTALGGALLTAGVTLGPLDRLVSPAGARAQADDGLDNEAFATFAVPLEMAAVQAYQAAISSDLFTADDAARLLSFQGHHQGVVDVLTAALPEGVVPRPDAGLQKEVTATITPTSTPTSVLTTLAGMEETLASTHLAAIIDLTDTSTAKTVAQVLAVESQQGALLGAAGGLPIEEETPALITTEQAITPSDAPSASN